MLFNQEDFSMTFDPGQAEAEAQCYALPIVMVTTKSYSEKPLVHLQFVVQADRKETQSLSVDLPANIALEFSEKLLAEEHFRFRDQVVDNEDSWLVMYRYTGMAPLTAGEVFQMMEFGVDRGNFELRISRSEPGGLDYTKHLRVLFSDWGFELQDIGHQLNFVGSILEEGE